MILAPIKKKKNSNIRGIKNTNGFNFNFISYRFIFFFSISNYQNTLVFVRKWIYSCVQIQAKLSNILFFSYPTLPLTTAAYLWCAVFIGSILCSHFLPSNRPSGESDSNQNYF